jgi:hypothetical protein
MTKLFDAVKPHMEVVSADGRVVGKVDHEEGQDRIKLTRDESGEHRFVNWDWVDRVSEGKLHLKLDKTSLQEKWKADRIAHIL